MPQPTAHKFSGAGRRLALALLAGHLLCAATGIAGGRWSGYEERILLERDGSAAVTVCCQVSAGDSGEVLELPYAFAAWPDAFWHSPNVAAVHKHEVAGIARVYVVLAGRVTLPESLTYGFRLKAVAPFAAAPPGDFGNYPVTYKSVNPLPLTIDRYTVTLGLPGGFVFANVVSTSPSRPPNGSGSPYVLGMHDGRHTIMLRDTSVTQGDVIALHVQARDGEKSPWLIVALITLGGAYLVAFRDLVVS